MHTSLDRPPVTTIVPRLGATTNYVAWNVSFAAPIQKGLERPLAYLAREQTNRSIGYTEKYAQRARGVSVNYIFLVSLHFAIVCSPNSMSILFFDG